VTEDGVDQALLTILSRVAHEVCQSVTHKELQGALVALGFPASTNGQSKADRADACVAALRDDQLPDVAGLVLSRYQYLDTATRNQLQDLLWARQSHPHIPKRARREVARALSLGIMQEHFERLRVLLSSLFVLDDDPFSGLTGRDNSLGARIDQHVHHNDNWTAEELFDALGAVDASDRRFAGAGRAFTWLPTAGPARAYRPRSCVIILDDWSVVPGRS
jgi:hypothetical protein